jgi:hypothetical protein
LGERFNGIEEVVGSIPSGSTTFYSQFQAFAEDQGVHLGAATRTRYQIDTTATRELLAEFKGLRCHDGTG